MEDDDIDYQHQHNFTGTNTSRLSPFAPEQGVSDRIASDRTQNLFPQLNRPLCLGPSGECDACSEDKWPDLG